MKKTAIILLAILAGFSANAQSVNLSYHLEKNKVYRFKSIANQNVSQSINGVQQNTTTESFSVVSIKMLDNTPEFFIAEIRFDSIFNKTNAMGKTVIMNSAVEGNIASSETGEVMSSILNRLSKNAAYAKIAYTGKVLEIINLKMLNDIILKDTAQVTGQTAPMIKTQIKSIADENALKTMIETYTFHLPGKEVKKGETWDMNSSITTGGMSMDILTNYKFEDLNTDMAELETESSIKASDNAAPMEFSGAKITYNGISGMSKGNLKINPATGTIILNESKINITGNLDLSMPGMNMQIPIEVTGETKVFLL